MPSKHLLCMLSIKCRSDVNASQTSAQQTCQHAGCYSSDWEGAVLPMQQHARLIWLLCGLQEIPCGQCNAEQQYAKATHAGSTCPHTPCRRAQGKNKTRTAYVNSVQLMLNPYKQSRENRLPVGATTCCRSPGQCVNHPSGPPVPFQKGLSGSPRAPGPLCMASPALSVVLPHPFRR
jgi:hypothetical protein